MDLEEADIVLVVMDHTMVFAVMVPISNLLVAVAIFVITAI